LSKFEAAVEEENARLAAETTQAETAFRTKQERLEAAYVKRRARIHKAHHGSRKMAIERSELEEGRLKYAVQKGLLDTERNRKAELAANDARHEEFKTRLAEYREAFVALEQQARRSFRGYSLFVQLLAEPGAGVEPDLSGTKTNCSRRSVASTPKPAKAGSLPAVACAGPVPICSPLAAGSPAGGGARRARAGAPLFPDPCRLLPPRGRFDGRPARPLGGGLPAR